MPTLGVFQGANLSWESDVPGSSLGQPSVSEKRLRPGRHAETLGWLRPQSVLCARTAVPFPVSDEYAIMAPFCDNQPEIVERAVAATVKNDSANVRLETGPTRALYLLSLAQPHVARKKTWYPVLKRAFDIVGAMLALLILAPAIIAIGIIVQVTSPGPAILAQQRIGKGGKVFVFYKFRSMYNNHDNSADKRFARDYINGNSQPTMRRDGVFKTANDDRVTVVGRYLRKTSLDELPQLLNVLLGDMSLVGPRPSMPYEVDVYKPWHFRRLEVLPGLTGLAQIKGRSSLVFKDIVKIDIEYIEHCSLLLDAKTLLKTIPVVLSTRGAR